MICDDNIRWLIDLILDTGMLLAERALTIVLFQYHF
jgi:hypothetical protein